MKRILYLISFMASAALMSAGCIKEEAMEVQKIPSPGNEIFDDTYYENLRAWKKSPHIITYVYYAAWAPLEGAENMYKEPSNMSERFIALPDSLDIVNLWMGIPSADPADVHEFSPTAAADMKYCQEVKGTRFVVHVDASHYSHTFTVNGKTYDLSTDKSEEAFRAYADYYVQQVELFGLDGIDYDFEGWDRDQIYYVVSQSGKYLGPSAETEEGRQKLNIVDYFGGSPDERVLPYLSYLVCQAYSEQIGHGYNVLRRPEWLPAEKFVLCEQWNQGSNRENGGYKPYNGYDNKPLMTYDENGNYVEMASLEAYARYCMDGNAGGFGAFYIDADYFFSKGPYWNLRRCIKIANSTENQIL